MKTVLTIDQTKFRINGELVYSEIKNCNPNYHGMLMNSRMIQGVFDDKEDVSRFNRYGKMFDPDKNTDELIEAMPEWYKYGLRAMTVGFQGGGPCFTINNYTINNNPFSADGSVIDEKYLARMKRLIEAADEIGMIIIVSYFYGAQTRFIKDDFGIMTAVKTASNWLRDNKFTNVIIEIANEQDVNDFKCHPAVYTPNGMAKLIEIAQRESGGMPVGCSSLGGKFYDEIAQASDVILIHGNGTTREKYCQHIKKAKAIKPARPIVCNEDSQAISQLTVTFNEQVSWGYYNNMTKQEPPTYWGITRGEDEFYAMRMAEFLSIPFEKPELENRYYLQGLEEHMTYGGERWIRLASLYPETINYVEFYRNDVLYTTAYIDPFTINYHSNWLQRPGVEVKDNDVWVAKVYLFDGTVIVKKAEK